MSYQISVIGSGYVGYSLALSLAKNNTVKVLDIDKEKISKLNSGIPVITETYIEDYLKNNRLDIKASDDEKIILPNSDFIFICTPTDYNIKLKQFDTSSITSSIEKISSLNKKANVIIRSTIPLGFIDEIQASYPNLKFIFMPEFLREGYSLFDAHNPSRIIFGHNNNHKLVENLKNIFNKAIIKKTKIISMSSSDAESVKLFANSFLAMRVAFFNELDSFCSIKNLNSRNVIKGVSLDNRIGDYYNNPSFGYGGYCLPKDSNQLLSEFEDIPQSLISATVNSNTIRKKFIVKDILESNPRQIGIFRLVPKLSATNYRNSSMEDISLMLFKKKVKQLIFEPLIKNKEYKGIRVSNDINFFKKNCDLILSNRIYPELSDVSEKVYTKDIFESDL